MSYELSNKTKELLSKRLEIPYEELIQMQDEEIEALIEQKTGKKITWPEGAKIPKQIITSIRTKGAFNTSCLFNGENIKEMDKRIEKNIAIAEQEISKGRDIINRENWIIGTDGER